MLYQPDHQIKKEISLRLNQNHHAIFELRESEPLGTHNKGAQT